LNGAFNSADVIFLFDWTGEPVLEIELSHPIISFFVEGNIIWGISPDFLYLRKFIIPEA